MHNELVHVARLFAEARHAVAALLRGAKLVFEEGRVLCADYGEVVGHCPWLAVVGRSCAWNGRMSWWGEGRLWRELWRKKLWLAKPSVGRRSGIPRRSVGDFFKSHGRGCSDGSYTHS